MGIVGTDRWDIFRARMHVKYAGKTKVPKGISTARWNAMCAQLDRKTTIKPKKGRP